MSKQTKDQKTSTVKTEKGKDIKKQPDPKVRAYTVGDEGEIVWGVG